MRGLGSWQECSLAVSGNQNSWPWVLEQPMASRLAVILCARMNWWRPLWPNQLYTNKIFQPRYHRTNNESMQNIEMGKYEDMTSNYQGKTTPATLLCFLFGQGGPGRHIKSQIHSPCTRSPCVPTNNFMTYPRDTYRTQSMQNHECCGKCCYVLNWLCCKRYTFNVTEQNLVLASNLKLSKKFVDNI